MGINMKINNILLLLRRSESKIGILQNDLKQIDAGIEIGKTKDQVKKEIILQSLKMVSLKRRIQKLEESKNE